MVYCGTIDVYYTGGNIKYQQLGFASLGVYNNWVLGTLIPIAQDFVDNHVGHDFNDNSGTILLDGGGRNHLNISRIGLVNALPPLLLPLPLKAITTVKIDSGADVSADIKMYDTFIRHDCNHFCVGNQNVEIVGEWGYDAVPDDIAYVTAQLCVNVLREAIRTRMVPDLITTIMEGSGAIGAIMRSPRACTVNEKEIMDKYRYREIEMG